MKSLNTYSLCQYTVKGADSDSVGLGWGQGSAFLTSSKVMLMLFPYHVLSGKALSLCHIYRSFEYTIDSYSGYHTG